MKSIVLKELVNLSKGKKHIIAEEEGVSSKRLIRIDDLRNNDNLIFTNDENGTEVNVDDVLIAWDGANAGTIGYRKNGFIGSTIVRLRSTQLEEFDSIYLGKFLQNKFNYLRNTATGATIPHINRNALLELKIPLPPLEDQKRIAFLLTRVEKLIVQRKESIQLLDELLKSTFLEMFGDPVRNEKGWNFLPFHKIGHFICGGTPNKSIDEFWNGEFPWVSPKDMKISIITDSEDHISENVFLKTNLKKIPINSLLIVVRGMILAHSFPVAINSLEVAINQDMKAILPIENIDVVYLKNCLSVSKRKILSLVTTAGHGTKRFDSNDMQKLLIPIPPKSLQNEFIIVSKKIESIKSCYQQSLTELENLYGSLSQKAFKGELDLSRIPVLENNHNT